MKRYGTDFIISQKATFKRDSYNNKPSEIRPLHFLFTV